MLSRYLTIALVAAMFATPATTAVARSHHRPPNWRHDECRYMLADHHPGFTTAEVAKTIQCAVDHWSVSGGYNFALCIAEHESGLSPSAGHYHSYHGVFQLGDGEFSGSYAAMSSLWHKWHVPYDTWNARANVLMAITKAHREGWRAWGTDYTGWGTVRFC